MNGETAAVTANAQARREVARGIELLRAGRIEAAAAFAEALLARWPAHAEVLFLACEARDAAGDVEGALAAIEAALVQAPDQVPLHLRRIDLLLVLRRRREARESALALEPLIGPDPRGLRAVGHILSRCEDPAAATGWFARALELAPGHPGLLYDLASARFFTGEFEAAERELDEALARAPTAGHAAYLRATLRRQTPGRNHVEDLRATLLRGIPDASSRAAAFYALAKELEDLGRDEESLRALHEGARTKRATLRYEVAGECRAIADIAEAYSAEAIAVAGAKPGEAGAAPVFVLGMPRTGTTLVERMLAQVPGVASAGELQDFGQALAAAVRPRLVAEPARSAAAHSLAADFPALGRDYLRGAREAARGSMRFIDKMPINFLYCGPILLALPEARIVHLVRDPMDTCYAVYRTLFHQAYHFSYDLDELAQYYIAYRGLMAHWHRVLPGRILDVHYEALVSDTRAQARRLLAYCGLDWHDAVLAPDRATAPATTASAAQVREPVHSRSVRKWRRHAAALEPLRRRLEAAGLVDANGDPIAQG